MVYEKNLLAAIWGRSSGSVKKAVYCMPNFYCLKATCQYSPTKSASVRTLLHCNPHNIFPLIIFELLCLHRRLGNSHYRQILQPSQKMQSQFGKFNHTPHGWENLWVMYPMKYLPEKSKLFQVYSTIIQGHQTNSLYWRLFTSQTNRHYTVSTKQSIINLSAGKFRSSQNHFGTRCAFIVSKSALDHFSSSHIMLKKGHGWFIFDQPRSVAYPLFMRS